MIGRILFAAVIVIIATTSPGAADPIQDSFKGTFSAAKDRSPDLCACGNGSHVDPVCALAFSAPSCVEAAKLAALGTCACLPDKNFQLSHFVTQIPTAVKSDGRDGIATLFAQLVRQASESGLLLENSDTGAKVLFQVFPATDGVNQLNTQQTIRNRLLQFATINLNAHIVMRSKEFGTAGIDPELSVSSNGRAVFAHGPIECPIGQKVSPLHVTVTQESIGAIAQGSWRKNCTGASQKWNLKAIQSGKSNPFVPGPAEVCAWAVFRTKSEVHTTKQWCSDVILSD